MLVHFSTLPHLMVTIETDDQTGLVATKAASVSKSEYKKTQNTDLICSVTQRSSWFQPNRMEKYNSDRRK